MNTVALFPIPTTPASAKTQQLGVDTVRTFTERKSTQENSTEGEVASDIDDVEVLDHAVDNLLQRYKGRYAALSALIGVPVHTIEKWGVSGLCRPRSWHVTRLCRVEPVFREMMAPALGEKAAPISPAELDLFLKFKEAIRATEIAATVDSYIKQNPTVEQTKGKSAARHGGAGALRDSASANHSRAAR